MRFIFFSKSMYDETPRIRHQLADLLIKFGHKVIFYQKPAFFYKKNSSLINKIINESIEIRQTKQLIHHQLRMTTLLSKINANYEKVEIISSLSCVDCEDVVLNFNYDYYFLREIFPKNKIITLINDDFIAQAKFRNGVHVKHALKETAEISNATLAVSYPLVEQCQEFTSSSYLFFPWSQEKYTRPQKGLARKKILLWAHIDKRVDFKLLKKCAKKLREIEFWIYGPQAAEINEDVISLKKTCSNVFFHSSEPLNKIDLSEFFCTIIPYKENVPDIMAVTASNKTFQLLAKGLPIVTYGMPSFLEQEAIYKAVDYNDFVRGIHYVQENFERLQPLIEKFVFNNQAADRYTQLQAIIARC